MTRDEREELRRQRAQALAERKARARQLPSTPDDGEEQAAEEGFSIEKAERDFHETPNLHAYHLRQGSDTLVVTFNTRILDGGVPRNGWGELRLGKLGYDVLAVIDLHGRWYPGADMRQLAEAVRPHLARYREIVTYGFSMGAYAALKYSALVGASRCYAFSPQYSIRPEDVAAFDPRRPREFYNSELHADMAIGREDVCADAYMVYDPFFAVDLEHARLISAAAPVHEVPAFFTDHFSIKVLTESGQAKTLLDDLAAGSPHDPRRLRDLIRAGRPGSNWYHQIAATRLLEKGDAHVLSAERLARRAVDLAPHDRPSRDVLLECTLRLSTAPAPTLPFWSRFQGADRRDAERLHIRKTEALRQLARDNSYFLADLLSLHATAGEKDKARTVARQAMQAEIEAAAYWIGLAEAVKGFARGRDDLALALELAQRALTFGRGTAQLIQLIAELQLAVTGQAELPPALFRPGRGTLLRGGQISAALATPCHIVRDGPRMPIVPGRYALSLEFKLSPDVTGPMSLDVEIEIGLSDLRGNGLPVVGPATPLTTSRVKLVREEDGAALTGKTEAFTIAEASKSLRISVRSIGANRSDGQITLSGMTLARI